MMKMEKVTIMERIDGIAFEGLTEEDFNFLVERARKSVRKGGTRKGLTKAQKENVGIKADILAVLEEKGALTATAVGNELAISCQKASALLKQMVDNGEVVKAKDGKATVFSAVAEDEGEAE